MIDVLDDIFHIHYNTIRSIVELPYYFQMINHLQSVENLFTHVMKIIQ